MCHGFVAATLFKTLDDCSHILHLFSIGDQHRIGGFNHHQIVHADRTDQPVLGEDVGVLRVDRKDVALQMVTVCIVLGGLPYR